MFLRRIKAEKERGKQRINPNITRQPAVLLSSTEPRLHNFFVSDFQVPPQAVHRTSEVRCGDGSNHPERPQECQFK